VTPLALGIPHLALSSLTARGLLAWSAKVLRYFSPCASLATSLLANTVILTGLVLALDSRCVPGPSSTSTRVSSPPPPPPPVPSLHPPTPPLAWAGQPSLTTLPLTPPHLDAPTSPTPFPTPLLSPVYLSRFPSRFSLPPSLPLRRLHLPVLTTVALLAVEAWILLYSVTGVVVYGVRSEPTGTKGSSCVWLGLFFCFATLAWLALMLWLRAHHRRQPSAQSRKLLDSPGVRVQEGGDGAHAGRPPPPLPRILDQPTSQDVRFGDSVRLVVVAVAGDAVPRRGRRAAPLPAPATSAHPLLDSGGGHGEGRDGQARGGPEVFGAASGRVGYAGVAQAGGCQC
jgi:hypothetical protein